MAQFNNLVLNITREATPDPYITYANGLFFMTFTAGNRVEVWKANSLPQFHSAPDRHVIWTPPPDTHHSADLWAPELHSLHGRWYVYYAAAHPAHGNRSHRTYVLGGPPADQDPTLGHWEFLGPIRGMRDHWAIDATVIELDHALYCVYSGWPFDNHNESDLIQQLFIFRMRDPVTADSPTYLLCEPNERWERTGDHGINEGPQFLYSLDNSWRGIVYSCSGSWTNEYKENTIQYVGGDPLNRASWRKGTRPLIQTRHNSFGVGHGPWGPGHGSFLHVGNETIHIYHATDSPTDGWNNRKARAQRVVFVNGQPDMGGEVGPMATSFQQFVSGSAGYGGPAQGQGSGDHKKHGLRAWMHRLKDEL